MNNNSVKRSERRGLTVLKYVLSVILALGTTVGALHLPQLFFDYSDSQKISKPDINAVEYNALGITDISDAQTLNMLNSGRATVVDMSNSSYADISGVNSKQIKQMVSDALYGFCSDASEFDDLRPGVVDLVSFVASEIYKYRVLYYYPGVVLDTEREHVYMAKIWNCGFEYSVDEYSVICVDLVFNEYTGKLYGLSISGEALLKYDPESDDEIRNTVRKCIYSYLDLDDSSKYDLPIEVPSVETEGDALYRADGLYPLENIIVSEKEFTFWC